MKMLSEPRTHRVSYGSDIKTQVQNRAKTCFDPVINCSFFCVVLVVVNWMIWKINERVNHKWMIAFHNNLLPWISCCFVVVIDDFQCEAASVYFYYWRLYLMRYTVSVYILYFFFLMFCIECSYCVFFACSLVDLVCGSFFS